MSGALPRIDQAKRKDERHRRVFHLWPALRKKRILNKNPFFENLERFLI
jgi:hypothetical protein